MKLPDRIIYALIGDETPAFTNLVRTSDRPSKESCINSHPRQTAAIEVIQFGFFTSYHQLIVSCRNCATIHVYEYELRHERL